MFTDFAYEAYQNEKNRGADARQYRLENGQMLRITTWTVAKKTEKDDIDAHYVAIQSPPLWRLSQTASDMVSDAVAKEAFGLLAPFLGKENKRATLLAVGLGNPDFTVDAIGPKTVRLLSATRHTAQEREAESLRFLLATTVPGIPASSGMGTLEQVCGIVSVVHPDAVIAIDSLAAKRDSHIGCVIQIGDDGLSPGSGVGERSAALTQRTLGIPVLALGIPTVVDSAAMLQDSLVRGGILFPSCKMKEEIARRRGFFVCPKESDWITDAASVVLANAIERLCREES